MAEEYREHFEVDEHGNWMAGDTDAGEAAWSEYYGDETPDAEPGDAAARLKPPSPATRRPPLKPPSPATRRPPNPVARSRQRVSPRTTPRRCLRNRRRSELARQLTAAAAPMIVVALTGGIGSGKSTVSQRLAERGAVIIDADAVARELQQAGSPVLDRIAERFGADIVGADGELDRAALATTLLFGTDLASLNDIVHPSVRAEMARRIAAEAGTDHVVVVDTPLLEVNPNADFARGDRRRHPVDVAVDRLVRHRGMTEGNARARIASQISRKDRRARADRVIRQLRVISTRSTPRSTSCGSGSGR